MFLDTFSPPPDFPIPAPQAFLTHTKRWYLLDAKGQKVGRLAAQISTVLQGKTKPIYHPSQLCGDHIVVINAKVRVGLAHWGAGFLIGTIPKGACIVWEHNGNCRGRCGGWSMFGSLRIT